ncbi:hypothetical protein BCR33DRAFT_378244 [Rhizoclosmatium globosum]|uniref:CFA20 domain-containing protein n=1 Tax=Rhizoclosmatium globosum TaxID=329046 RepID=A0A1Y2BZ06_9FUNG|nr:hypothetical protein BCR33DRAFT_378244 [Rhizoclosmatium globosum]|eukprot:ORY39914.1 hypothetical protein BCR33DRAFT_378244 [Rhizoclosmatium globosum]
MFKSAFQGGPSFEVFSCQGSSSSAMLNWRIVNKQFVHKEYEKDVKGYCFTCDKAGKLQLPKDEKQSAYLIQPYLILQIFVGVAQHMTIEICVSDLNQSKRRFFISTAAKETKNTALHVTLPLGFLKRGVWLNLCFDLLSLVGDSFRGQTFRCLDSIAISGNYRLRKVFTMKLPPPDTTDDYDLYDENIQSTLGLDCIPKTLQYGIGIDHVTQVINLHRIRAAEKLEMRKSLQDIDEFQHWPSKSNEALPKLAFGTRPSSEVVYTNPKKKEHRKRRIKTAKSNKDENGNVVTKTHSRTSIRTNDSATVEETNFPGPTLPPIIEVRTTPPGLESKPSEDTLCDSNDEEARPITDYNPSKYAPSEPSADRELTEMVMESERDLVLLKESIPVLDITASREFLEAVELEAINPQLDQSDYKIQPEQKQHTEEKVDSNLDEEIDAFFKAQEEQNEEVLGIQDEEGPADVEALDDNYISHGNLNMTQIIATLDGMMESDDKVLQASKVPLPETPCVEALAPLKSVTSLSGRQSRLPSNRHSTNNSRSSLMERILSKSKQPSSVKQTDSTITSVVNSQRQSKQPTPSSSQVLESICLRKNNQSDQRLHNLRNSRKI